MAASPGRCAKENMPKLPTLPFTLSNTSTLICAHTLLPSFHLFSNGTSLPTPLFLPPPFFTLQSALTLVFCSLSSRLLLAVQRGLFKLRVFVTNRSGVQFPLHRREKEKKKPLPYFVTILYSGEKYSVGLRVNFNCRDTPQLLNAALFFFSSAWQFCIGMTDNIQPSASCLYLVCVWKTTRVSHKLEFSQVFLLVSDWLSVRILRLMTRWINE